MISLSLPFFQCHLLYKDRIVASPEILVDTGSSVTLIHRKIIPQHINLNKNHRITYATANSTMSSSLGVVHLNVKPTFRTKSNAESISVHFHVVNDLPVDALLGYDCIRNSIINIRERMFLWRTATKSINVQVNATFASNLVSNTLIPNDNEILARHIERNHSMTKNVTDFIPSESDIDKLIPTSLTVKLQNQLREILNKNKNVFVETSRPTLFKYGDHQPLVLPLTSNWVGLPRQYPFPPRLNDVLFDQIKTWLEDDVIEPQPNKNVPYRTNVLPIQKKDKSYRICLDCRNVNSGIKQEVVYLPPPVKIVADIAAKKFISSIDISSFFLSFRLDPKSRDLLTFSDPNGKLYRPKNTPFGLKWSMGNAVNMLTAELTALPNHHSWLRQFVDDITIFDDCEIDHMSHIKAVLSLLNKLNLKIK